MFQALSDLYTLGELDQVKQKLLHTTSWKQHEFTAYGQSQIEKAWLSSIALFGFSHLLEKQFIKGEKHSAIFLKLANKNNDELSFSLIFEHNKDVIKRVNCIVDTQRLATFAQVSVDEFWRAYRRQILYSLVSLTTNFTRKATMHHQTI